MTLSIFQVAGPTFDRRLKALSAVIDKAAAHAEAKKIDPAALIDGRLYPDMFPFWRQVQAATTHAANATARLAGADLPDFGDIDKTFDGLKARIEQALAAIHGFRPGDLAGGDERTVTLMLRGQERQMTGLDYFLNSALPNFYFHVTTAYDILRHNGVEIGKRDFIG
jgi:hypothetical protein